MDEVIQKMASELIIKNMENFNRAQKKHLQLNLDFGPFVQVLLVHIFPTLLRAWFRVARSILSHLARAQSDMITFLGICT